MKIKTVILASTLASVPLSSNVNADCSGLNSRQAFFQTFLQVHKTDRSIVVNDKIKYAKGLKWLNHNVRQIPDILARKDDLLCTQELTKLDDAVDQMESASERYPPISRESN